MTNGTQNFVSVMKVSEKQIEDKLYFIISGIKLDIS